MLLPLLLACSGAGSPPGVARAPLPPDLGQPATVLDAVDGVCV